MVAEYPQEGPHDGGPPRSSEALPIYGRGSESLHFIALDSPELARLSAPRKDEDYSDGELTRLEGVQMPICAARELLAEESIRGLQALAHRLETQLGYDPHLQIAIAGPLMRYERADHPHMYPAHLMTSFEMHVPMTPEWSIPLRVLGPVCVSLAHPIMKSDTHPLESRMRVTEGLLRDLVAHANGLPVCIAMPERKEMAHKPTSASLLNGTELAVNGSPTHALMTHLAGEWKPRTIQVATNGTDDSKPYTLYPLLPDQATSLGEVLFKDPAISMHLMEVVTQIIQVWESNFQRHLDTLPDGMPARSPAEPQEVGRVMTLLPGYERRGKLEQEERQMIGRLISFLNSLVEFDGLSINSEKAGRFVHYATLMLQEMYLGTVPHEIQEDVHRALWAIVEELSTADVSANSHKFAISEVTHALYDMLFTHLSGYKTAPREDANAFAMQYADSEGLKTVSMAEIQRRYTVDMQRNVWEFIRAHPEFPVCGQILLDWVHTIQASDQSTHPLFVDYKTLKARFYELFVNMNKDVPTTDSQVDIARTASIIRSMHAEGKMLNKAAVAGSGDMSRLEGPLFILLRELGITFDEIVAVDRVNYGVQIAVSHPELNVDFHQGDILDANAFGGKKVNVLLYPWSVFSDILPRKDSVQALHTAAGLMEPGGILIIDQAIPIGESSYKRIEEEQAPMTGELGVFQRSFSGPDGQELWSTFNIMNMETLLRDAAQAGFIPRNVGPTAQEQRSLIDKIESDESVLVREAETGENHDAMKYPIYQANGWNRMTLALEYVGQEEALRRAKAAPSLFHTLSLAVGEAKDGSQ
ncbi:MAG TPA: hypothetical protein PKG71_01955 [Candidatus Woesebacteria bacterium]|nr:hypothetical protein [Candidatus Woesebacteria bacterium]HNS94710.1 hypothetical protein [Candidatus Woesebacteria bacterium]